MEQNKTYMCNYRFYPCQFRENANNYLYSGFLSPRVAYIKKGKCTVKTEKETFFLKAGTTWFLPRFYPYSSHWIADPEVEFYAVEFEADAFGAKYTKMQTFDDLPVGKDFENLKNAMENKQEFSALSALYAILASIEPRLEKEHNTAPQAVLRLVDFITENYKTDFTVQELARDCFLSESRFYHLFKKATGFSPVDYKNYLKISHAASDLLLGSTLEELCEEYRFCSPSYFRRLFKKFTGSSPSEFKRNYEKL